MPVYKAEGIVLGRRNLGEADRILTLLTREHGKLAVKAKAVRRPTSRLAGRLEPFTHARFLLARGRTLDVVAQVEVVAGFAALRADLLRTAWAAVCTELTDRMLQELEPHPEVFEALLQAQEVLAGGDPEVATLWYALRLISLLGYRPVLDRCARCGQPVRGSWAWHITAGGLLCTACALRDPQACGIRGETVGALRFLSRARPRDLARLRLSAPARAEALDALMTYAEARIEGRLRSLGVLRALQVPSARPHGGDILERKTP
ncbi:MAG: DNA repair protein RecO [Armatimonadota bacterium]|nr:DNA repair protein RecO [Armatimonadota bacterium]MDR7438641.1 DNA repair protein RecO [Armatimonadota bacterium]MDR7562638.1 DNA repair protein RecO [Armatimonadota bacterium]MDR7567208.1 DNA repair protein RecO [Armatimonadota bacterium]MDR7602781.1 DNA repair protein RecO [Armatimonadota bacterium]